MCPIGLTLFTSATSIKLMNAIQIIDPNIQNSAAEAPPSLLGLEHDPVTIKAAKRASIVGGLTAIGAGIVGTAPSTVPLAAVGPYAYFMQAGLVDQR